MVIRRRKPILLSNADDVIVAAFGTTMAAARATRRPIQSVSNWRRRGKLPPATFLIFSEALAAKNMAAPCSLWGIDPGAVHTTTLT
jgi:hypothetical protein